MYIRINLMLSAKKNVEKDLIVSVHLANLSVP